MVDSTRYVVNKWSKTKKHKRIMESTANTLSKNRNDSIDILRFFAILGIIIIHCNPHNFFISQVRGFDVPLMVFLAGVGFGLSYKRSKTNYWQYVWKRFKRMVLPTWIFLFFLTVVTFVTTKSLPDKAWMIETFTLTTREWYVWIIRVLFLMAIVAPLTIPRIDKAFSVGKFVLVSIVLFITLELAPRGTISLPLYLVLEFVPFFIVFVYGCEINRFNKKQLLLIALITFLVYLTYAIFLYYENSQLVNTQVDKYPPPSLLYFLFIVLYFATLGIQRENRWCL